MKEKLIICILVLVIIVLCTIMIIGMSKTKGGIVSNKALTVLDNVTFEEYENEEMLVLKVQNKSAKAFVNLTPVLIYYDENNMPIHEGWGARVSYFAPNDIRYIEFYDTIKEFSKVELGFFEREDKNQFTDVRDKVSYTVEKANETDENGIIRLNFKGENKTDKEVCAEFQIAYYSKDELIYEDSFMVTINANSPFDIYEEYITKFNNGKEFPAGYTYEVILAEAVENIEDASEKMMNISELSDADKVEYEINKLLKNKYGDDLLSAKISVDKIYTAKEVEEDELLKSLDIKDKDIAFEISIKIEPAEGADIIKFTVPDGEYNEETGWVSEIYRLGILRYNEETDTYSVDNYGTGW